MPLPVGAVPGLLSALKVVTGNIFAYAWRCMLGLTSRAQDSVSTGFRGGFLTSNEPAITNEHPQALMEIRRSLPWCHRS